jgi:hypothetical protein
VDSPEPLRILDCAVELLCCLVAFEFAFGRNRCCRLQPLALNGLSILRQISERLNLPTAGSLLEEFIALARAQRRTPRAAHRQLEADPLMAHLLESRIVFRRADAHRTKSGKRADEMVMSSFFRARAVGFRGEVEERRALLEIYLK